MSIHNPSQFEPSDYEVEDYLDNKRPAYYGQSIEAYTTEVDWWKADMTRIFGADYPSKIHSCAHCGNSNIRWITAVRHIPTGDIIVFGSDCTDRLRFTNKVAFKLALLKSKADKQAENFKAHKAKLAFIEAHPELAPAIEAISNPIHAKNSFAHDVVGKLQRWGSISPAQISALLNSMERDRVNAARREAEADEVKGPAPEGRIAVTGTVLTVKEQESVYGMTLKLLVKLENNAKVWVTKPSGADVDRGDVITIKATWTVSDKDPHFAFGKRPIVEKVTKVGVGA